MWDFIFGPEGVHSQRINLIWLGLNSNVYHELLKEEASNINSLHISEICDKIWKSVTELRLNVISNLLKGTCVIHKAQVDCLYGQTKNLYCFQNQGFPDLSEFSQKANTDTLVKSEELKKSIWKNENQKLFEETEDFSNYDESNFCSTTENTNNKRFTCQENEISLKDVFDDQTKTFSLISTNIFNDMDEDYELGELTLDQKNSFLEIINAGKQETKIKSRVNNLRILNTLPSDETNDISFDLPRQNIEKDTNFLNNTEYIQPKFENVDTSITGFNYDVNTSVNGILCNLPGIQIKEPNASTLTPVLSNIILPTLTNQFDEQSTPQIFPTKRAIEKNDGINSELQSEKRHKRLKIDKFIEFSAEETISFAFNLSIFRNFTSREDIVPLKQLKLKTSETLISTPCVKLPTPLLKSFKRNLKRRKRPKNDFRILENIITDENEMNDICEISNCKKRKNISECDKKINNLNYFVPESNEIKLLDNTPSHKQNNFSDTKHNNTKYNFVHIEKIIENLEILNCGNNESSQSECGLIIKLKIIWKRIC